MDEQTSPTSDPIPTNSPATEPPLAEPVSVPETAQAEATAEASQTPPETPTAHFPPNEPLPDPVTTSDATQSPSTQAPAQPEPASLPASMPAQAPVIVIQQNRIKDFFAKAAQAIQFRKQKKLTKIMGLFLKKTHITNDEVEKLLHVSDATATRYLSQLEKQGKIRQSAKTGQGVTYTKL